MEECDILSRAHLLCVQCSIVVQYHLQGIHHFYVTAL